MSLSGGLAKRGAAVTFSRVTGGGYDPLTGITTSPSVVTVTGKAMQIDGDPETYAALGLLQSENPTLLFRPDTVGVMPTLGSTVVWGADTLTVKDIETLAMAGTPTAARVRCAR